MSLIDTWALTTACRDGAWLASRGHPVEVAVNVTASQLTSPRFIWEVEDAASAAELPLTSLTFELGLRDVLSHIYAARDVALALRRRGARVSVSEIGAGASAPERLSPLKVGEVKVDRGLIAALEDPTIGSAAVVAGVVAVAHASGARVVAEGIETVRQHEAALEAGCDRAQGYLLGRPAPLEDLTHRFPRA